MRTVTLALMVAVVMTIVASSGQTAPAPGTTLFVAPKGSDSGPCTQTRPCLTFQRAYEQARSGDVVLVAGGTYPSQRLSHDPTKVAAGDVVFRPAPGANVTTGDLEFGARPSTNPASHVTVDGENRWISGEIGFYLRDPRFPARDITIANLKLRRDAGVFIRGADHITLRNVEIGPTCCTTDGMNISPNDDGGAQRNVTNLVLDGIKIHDIVRYCAQDPNRLPNCVDNPEAHTDCIQAWTGVNVVIRNSRFYNCSTSSLIVLGGYGGRVENWTIENNFFGLSLEDSFNFIFFVGNQPDLIHGALRIRYNSISGSIKVEPEGRAADSTVDVVGNIAVVGGGCSVNVRYAYNLFTDGRRCAPTDRIGKAQFVADKPLGTDLHVQRDSDAIGAGNPRDRPQTDIDGGLRPLRAAPDAGADQRERPVVVPGRSVGSITIGKSRQAVEAWYGPARLRRSAATGLSAGVYRMRGGVALTAYYEDDRVVAVSTRSPFYTTLAGIGPGVRATRSAGTWDACLRVYRRGTARRATVFTTAGARPTGVVREVTVATTPLRASGWPLRCR